MCKEMRSLFSVLVCVYLIQGVFGDPLSICGAGRNSSSAHSRSCSTQILGKDHSNLESCQVEAIPPNSPACKMVFGPIVSNAHIGNVRLKPYILNSNNYAEKHSMFNYTVLNITFSNIKWNTMKFRFQRFKDGIPQNHCRNIVISRDVSVNDQSVLYYDCYWSVTDQNYTGQTHILDFEAADDKYINRGRYFFNIPSESMLNPNLTVEEWKPFTYIEIHTNTMKLHILPPTNPLPVKSYRIEVVKEGEKGTDNVEIVKTSTVKIKNTTQEVVYEYSWPNVPGSYYFVVTPLHPRCDEKMRMRCQSVESPRVTISSEVHQNLNICIASVSALVVATLFAYYIALRLVRRYWCKDYSFAMGKEIPTPPRILIIYSPANKLHAECVSSFVNYLRSEYGFDVMYDCDISATSHNDPYIWAEEAFRISTHVLYIVGPPEEANIYNNIYDQPIISPLKDVDLIMLALLKSSRVTKHCKDVVNVYFEHSNGNLPVETRHDKCLYLLKDWQKLISYLSKNLLPKQQMLKTEKGRCFLEDLKRAKKLLTGNHDNVVIKCEKMKLNPFETNALL